VYAQGMLQNGEPGIVVLSQINPAPLGQHAAPHKLVVYCQLPHSLRPLARRWPVYTTKEMEATEREMERLLTSPLQGNWLASCTTDCRVQHLCRCRMPGLDGRVLGCRQLRKRQMLVSSNIQYVGQHVVFLRSPMMSWSKSQHIP